jgi:hypothetical protein
LKTCLQVILKPPFFSLGVCLFAWLWFHLLVNFKWIPSSSLFFCLFFPLFIFSFVFIHGGYLLELIETLQTPQPPKYILACLWQTQVHCCYYLCSSFFFFCLSFFNNWFFSSL